MAELRLSNESRLILSKLDISQLSFLSSIKLNKDFQTFQDVVNLLIDIEKNSFFGDDESKYENPVWQARHAYARGGIAKLIMLLNIIVGAEVEMQRREQERKKRKDGSV